MQMENILNNFCELVKRLTIWTINVQLTLFMLKKDVSLPLSVPSVL